MTTAVRRGLTTHELVLPGYSRPMVRVEDYLALLERSTYDDQRVRAA